MTEAEIRQLAALRALEAELEAVRATVEGMKAENAHRLSCGNSIAYGDAAFFEVNQEFDKIAKRFRTEI